jgi:hypothetical protein
MSSPTLGAVLLVGLMTVGVAVLGFTLAVGARRRHTLLTMAASAAALVVVGAALWFFVSPVSVDGVFCNIGSPVDGLFRDSSLGADAYLPSCEVQSRKILGWWSIPVLAAVGAWAVVLRQAQRTDLGNT